MQTATTRRQYGWTTDAIIRASSRSSRLSLTDDPSFRTLIATGSFTFSFGGIHTPCQWLHIQWCNSKFCPSTKQHVELWAPSLKTRRTWYPWKPSKCCILLNSLIWLIPTLCLKKVLPLNLYVTLSNINWFQNFCTAGKRIKFATKPTQQYPSHLRHVATLPWDIKNSNFLQIFSKYGKNANKLHFQCNNFNSSVRITVYAERIYEFLSKYCPHRWMPCWLLTNTAVMSAVTNFWCHRLIVQVNKHKNTVTQKILCAISMVKNSLS